MDESIGSILDFGCGGCYLARSLPKKDVFEYDIFNCPSELKGQLKIGDFSG